MHTVFVIATHTHCEQGHVGQFSENTKFAKPWAQQPNGVPLRLGNFQKIGPETVLLLDATEQNSEAILLRRDGHLVLLPNAEPNP